MPSAFRADKAAGVDVVFQYRITGPGGGEWHTVVKDGTCDVKEGAHGKPTTTISSVTTSEESFTSVEISPACGVSSLTSPSP